MYTWYVCIVCVMHVTVMWSACDEVCVYMCLWHGCI